MSNGFPGLPGYGAYPNPQTPPAAAPAAPPGYPAPPPGYPQPPAVVAAPPGYPAPPPGYAVSAAPAAPQPAAYGAPPPGYPAPAYGAHGAYSPPTPDLAARIAAATLGVQKSPRLSSEQSCGGYALEIIESGKREGESKAKKGQFYKVLFIEFKILNSTCPNRLAGTQISTAFDLLNDPFGYEIKRLTQFAMGFYNAPQNDPRVLQIGATLEANALVGQRCQAFVQPQANGKRGKSGELYTEVLWRNA